MDRLDERSSIYSCLPSAEAERTRGRILASFASGLPAEGLPFVLEELETGVHPYPVAGAARALSGCASPPLECAGLIASAIRRLAAADDEVSFEEDHGEATTLLKELASALTRLPADHPRAAAIAGLGSDINMLPRGVADLLKAAASPPDRGVVAAGCCCVGRQTEEAQAEAPAAAPRGSRSLESFRLTDQAGAPITFGSFLGNRPSVVTFFYTRCNNPNKCSSNVTALARLAERLAEMGVLDQVNVAAITYDPAFDTPPRMSVYGANRGMPFDDRVKMLRSDDPFSELEDAFGLGVNFGPMTVNHHRLEMFVLDKGGDISAAFTRRLWDEDEVISALKVERKRPMLRLPLD